ncbi:hypothetical protein Q4I28_006062 [Leishmania naiffi]|uniref:Secreted protein n=1 Tax=Leishmania naiffi TaxID=5678 RepID=A0AAW3BIB4_9TRYP
MAVSVLVKLWTCFAVSCFKSVHDSECLQHRASPVLYGDTKNLQPHQRVDCGFSASHEGGCGTPMLRYGGG